MKLVLKRLRATVLVLLLVVAAAAAAIGWQWQSRPTVSALSIPEAIAEEAGESRVSVRWLGISTLLFDDGDTQIMTDATFSRPELRRILLLRELESDYAAINRGLDEHRIVRLAAIVPVHSHFDHAIDAGHVANRTDAVVLGSESTSNIARGSGVPVDQYQTLKSGEPRYFGDFTVTLIESQHVAQLPNGKPIFSGVITRPLEQPAPVSAWHSGTAYSVLIAHPAGTALVQGSAGFVPGRLAEVSADVVFLSIAGVATRGRAYAEEYWRHTVLATGAHRVYPIHFEDFTRPFGDVVLFPDIVDDVPATVAWIKDFADSEGGITLALPPLGRPLALY